MGAKSFRESMVDFGLEKGTITKMGLKFFCNKKNVSLGRDSSN